MSVPNLNNSLLFIAASSKDFNVRARSICDVSELNLSNARDILARIYGHQHYHAYRIAAKSNRPGPYHDMAIPNESAEDAERRKSAMNKRAQDILEQIDSPATINLLDLHLFDGPQARKNWSKRMRNMNQNVAEAEFDIPTSARGYGFRHKMNAGAMSLNAIGVAFREKRLALIEKHHFDSDDIITEALENLRNEHPNNPTIHAELAMHLVPTAILSAPARAESHDSSINADIIKMLLSNAGKAYDYAIKAIELYESLTEAPAEDADKPAYSFAKDEHGYADALYVAGAIDAARGQFARAESLLTQAIGLSAGNPSDARSILATVLISQGKPVSHLLNNDQAGFNCALIKMIDAWESNDREAASAHLISAMMESPYVLARWAHIPENVSKEWEPNANYQWKSAVDEFMIRTRQWWETHPVAEKWVRSIAQIDPIRDCLSEIHAFKGKIFRAARSYDHQEKQIMQAMYRQSIHDLADLAKRLLGTPSYRIVSDYLVQMGPE